MILPPSEIEFRHVGIQTTYCSLPAFMLRLLLPEQGPLLLGSPEDPVSGKLGELNMTAVQVPLFRLTMNSNSGIM